MADPSPPPAPEAEPTTPPPPTSGAPTKDPLRRSRTSGAFVALVLLGLLLVLLIVFIAQNTQDVHVSFLTWDGTTPLAVALLIAAGRRHPAHRDRRTAADLAAAQAGAPLVGRAEIGLASRSA